MTSKKIVETLDAPAALGPYSQGIEYRGVYYFSGQIGIDPKTNQMRDTFEQQAQQILDNIDGILKSCDLTRKHIIKTTIFLIELEQFATINELYKNYFTPPFPARSCLEVSRLPKDALIEIEVMACSK